MMSNTVEEMKAWLKPSGYSDAINNAAINFILREFAMSKVPSGSLCNAEMIVELFRPQLEHQISYFSHQPSLRLYHYRGQIGSPSAFIKSIWNYHYMKEVMLVFGTRPEAIKI